MEKPILVVMAAGLGSRYGGLKQMDAVGDNGEWIIDFSLYDAYQAGFRDVVFVIRAEILEDFKETIGKRIAGKYENIYYAVQTLDDMPEGFTLPDGRTKPWGTAHAVYSARKEIAGKPVMAINADDYYGPEAFRVIYNHLTNVKYDASIAEYAMVGFLIKNTVTPHGHVARGVCAVDDDYLVEVIERTNIQMFDDGIKYSEDDGDSWIVLPPDTPVSLNCWAFTPKVEEDIDKEFVVFLNKLSGGNPLKDEYFLPSFVEEMIKQDKAVVKVLPSHDKWYGMTYHEDKIAVSAALVDMKKNGLYPSDLWK